MAIEGAVNIGNTGLGYVKPVYDYAQNVVNVAGEWIAAPLKLFGAYKSVEKYYAPPGAQPGAPPGAQPDAPPGAPPGAQPDAQPGALPGALPGAQGPSLLNNPLVPFVLIKGAPYAAKAANYVFGPSTTTTVAGVQISVELSNFLKKTDYLDMFYKLNNMTTSADLTSLLRNRLQVVNQKLSTQLSADERDEYEKGYYLINTQLNAAD
jgi:hypothetical protein